MGTGGILKLFGSVTFAAVHASGEIWQLPTTMMLRSNSGRIEYDGSLQPALKLSVAAGRPCRGHRRTAGDRHAAAASRSVTPPPGAARRSRPAT